MKRKFINFMAWMDGLKHNRTTLYVLIALDVFLAVGSNIADWPWLTSVKWYLLPFTPICSLYTLLIALWFILFAFKKKVPNLLTSFIFMAITSYGIMAYIYFPLYMSWVGVDFRNVGNMVWVTVYALQALIILSELKPLPLWQYLLIFLYFGAKDYSDRYLGSFWDFLEDGYPVYLMQIFTVSMVALQLIFGAAIILIPWRRQKLRQKTVTEKKLSI